MLVSLQPEESTLDLLEKLRDGRFNQVHVLDGGECLGVVGLFEVMYALLCEPLFRDPLRMMKMRDQLKIEPRDIGADDRVDVGFDWRQDDLAIVRSPCDLKGMLIATDILNRLTDYARAFVRPEAFEHGARARDGLGSTGTYLKRGRRGTPHTRIVHGAACRAR